MQGCALQNCHLSLTFNTPMAGQWRCGMAEPFLRGFSRRVTESPSWFARVRENLRQLFTTVRLRPTSANGAPIHLLRLESSGRAGSSQTVSLITHLGILVVLCAALAGKPSPRTDRALSGVPVDRLFYSAARVERISEVASLGHKGGGGESDPVPAGHGFFAPRSAVQLAPPRLPDDSSHLLPVAAT